MRAILFSFFLLMSAFLSAQAPALIPYQAVARDGEGQTLASSTINARFTLHDATATGTAVWQELQTITTSSLGLFTAQLGGSVPLTAVDWSSGAKFIQVEFDLGNGFIDLGTQQLLSVPFALHAASVRLNVSNTGDTLFVGDGSYVLIPGISLANNGGSSSISEHTCGTTNVHNSNLLYGNVTDHEGNVYKTIVIGSQEWMAENLNVASYADGTPLPEVTDPFEWDELTTGAWCYYNNEANYACPYGKLYNWYACVDARQLCPTGWHVPTDDDWLALTNYLVGVEFAGGKMKTTGTVEASTGFFLSPNADASNSSGFSAIPGGGRYSAGIFNLIGAQACWWSSTAGSATNSWDRYLLYNFGSAYRGSGAKQFGFSVRCLRD